MKRDWTSYLGVQVLKGLSRLPLGLLYSMLQGIGWLVFEIGGYRKQVIRTNLSKCFPEYTQNQRNNIEKGFKMHLMELAAEVIKGLSASEKMLEKRVQFKATEGLQALQQETDKGAIVVMAHYGNWEWAGLRFGELGRKRQVVYMKQKNKEVNDMMLHMRERFGNKASAMEAGYKLLVKDKTWVTFLLADQVPHGHQVGLWTEFLGRETAFFAGPEQLARRLQLPMYYAVSRRKSRGHYEVEFVKMTHDVSREPELAMTKEYVRLLEAEIARAPEQWLWSHKRWKRVRSVQEF